MPSTTRATVIDTPLTSGGYVSVTNAMRSRPSFGRVSQVVVAVDIMGSPWWSWRDGADRMQQFDDAV